ncbi:MAG: hypothetical protein ACRC4N_01015 [Gammaproteobacteria bacterium]
MRPFQKIPEASACPDLHPPLPLSLSLSLSLSLHRSLSPSLSLPLSLLSVSVCLSFSLFIPLRSASSVQYTLLFSSLHPCLFHALLH